MSLLQLIARLIRAIHNIVNPVPEVEEPKSFIDRDTFYACSEFLPELVAQLKRIERKGNGLHSFELKLLRSFNFSFEVIVSGGVTKSVLSLRTDRPTTLVSIDHIIWAIELRGWRPDLFDEWYMG